MAPTALTASAARSTADPLFENKQTVREFYDLAFAQRRPNDAAARCVVLPRMADGLRRGSAQAHLSAVIGWLDSMPRLKVDVRQIVADGDLVVVQSAFTGRAAGSPGPEAASPARSLRPARLRTARLPRRTPVNRFPASRRVKFK